MGCGSSNLTQPELREVATGDLKANASNNALTEDNESQSKIGTIPAEEDEDAQAKLRKKSKASRTRRLSYVSADAAAQESPPETRNDEGSGKRKKSSTRARRLSYIGPDGANGEKPNVPDGAESETGDIEEVSVAKKGNAPSGEPSPPIMATVACISRVGREPGYKKTNQDNCFAFQKYMSEDQALFGAFDGHGPNGHLVSGYVKQHMPIMLVQQMQELGEEQLVPALSKTFVDIDRSLASGRIDCEFSGTTAVVSFLKGRTLTTAWVGDSRAVIGRMAENGKMEAYDLTKDHKPTSPAEKARILAANGRVDQLSDDNGDPIGPHRVWLQYSWIPGLAMSRALGDVLAHQVGVTSEPDHTVCELLEDDKFLILASDGIWEFIDSQEAVTIVSRSASAEDACHQLVDEAYQRWMVEEDGVVDDITAVVVLFDH